MAERKSIVKKVYVAIDSDGKESDHRSVVDGVDRLEFRFTNDSVRTVRTGEFPANIQAAAMWHGFSQKLGDKFSGAKGVASAAVEMFDEMVAQLLEGDWTTAAEGGAPRFTQLAVALFAAATEAGETVTEAECTELVKGWSTDERKAASELPEIAAALADIRLKAAQERAKAAKAALKAEGATGGLAGLFGKAA